MARPFADEDAKKDMEEGSLQDETPRACCSREMPTLTQAPLIHDATVPSTSILSVFVFASLRTYCGRRGRMQWSTTIMDMILASTRRRIRLVLLGLLKK